MSWIEWPPGCDPGKHFPSIKERFNVSDPRAIASFRAAVGGSNSIREALIIPLRPRKQHTRESIEAEIREHFTKTGKRPTSQDLHNADCWLRERGSSVHLLCNRMGLPGERVRYTRESIEADIREHFSKTGKRPPGIELPRQSAWLRVRGSSLSKLCDELNLPGGLKKHTRESVEADIREHFAKTGKRPTQRDLPGQFHWLKMRHGSSLTKLCDELGLPKARRGRHAK